MTRYGSGVVYATAQGVVKVDIPDVTRNETVQRMELPRFEPSDITVHAAGMLQRYFHGERIDFGDIPVDLAGMTPFRYIILAAIRELSYGEISTYGQVARECGSPYAARAAGGALASNPIPIIIPCHRVVASDGRLTGFSAPGGEGSKMELLKMEGVEFKGLLVDVNQMVIHRTPCR
jgi:methylated-DNA-[protein]-cysteine S-methyltransferase